MSRYDVERVKWDEKARAFLERGSDLLLREDYETIFSSFMRLAPIKRFLGDIDLTAALALDFGCGQGWTSMLLATTGCRVIGFDISEMNVHVAKVTAEYNKLNNADFTVADGEKLPFQDGSFDLVFGNAVLHHLRLDACLGEIARVLKPGGKAAFAEPFGHNLLINLYRLIKHNFIERHHGTDRPLKYADIETFKRHFPSLQFQESSFLRDFVPCLRPLERVLLKVPFLRSQVCYVAVLLQK